MVLSEGWRRMFWLGVFASFLAIISSVQTFGVSVYLYVASFLVIILALSKTTHMFFSIDSDYKTDFIYGFILGAFFILINKISPAVSIGYPQVVGVCATASLSGPCLSYIVALAGVVEEIIFRSWLMSFLNSKYGKSIAIVGQAILFGLAHIFYYGLERDSAIVGAMFFGLIAGLVTFERRSIIPSVVMHMMFNLYLWSQPFIIIV